MPTLMIGAVLAAAPVYSQTHNIKDIGTVDNSVSPRRMNDAGQVIGQVDTSTGHFGFIYNGTTIMALSLGGTHSFAHDLNEYGDVVGWSYVSNNAAQHAFVFSNGMLRDLNDLLPANSGWILTHATAINDAGQITGHGILNNQGGRAFLYTPSPTGSTIVDLGSLGGTHTWPEDINSSGEVAGYSHTTNNSRQHAFVFTSGTMTDLGTLGGNHSAATALNDAGQVTGWANTLGGQQHVFLFSNGTMTGIGTLGGPHSYPSGGINASGQIAGYAYINNFSSHRAFLYSNGTIADLGTLGGTHSFASDLNDSGVVAGWSFTQNDQRQVAFQYSAGAMQDLNSLVSTCSNRVLHYAVGVNNTGQFSGYGSRPGIAFGFLMSPESPASILPATLSVRPATGAYNGSASVSATLSAEACGISGAQIDFTVAGLPVITATTDADGLAFVDATLQGISAGYYPDGLLAEFAGTPTRLGASDTSDLTVLRSDTNLTWPAPAPIPYGTPLGPQQLNATTDTLGTFVYTPAVGTILPGGTHALSVTFVAEDSVNYLSPIHRSVSLTVTGAQPSFGNSDLGTVGGDYSQAVALNDAGQVTGWASTAVDQFQRAFLFSDGAMTDLGTFGGTHSYPQGGINASGQVAGYAYTTNNANYRAFLHSNGSTINLGTLGGQYSQATDLNDAGQVTGWAYTSSNLQHAFLYGNGTMLDIGTLGGSYSYPNAGINAVGQVAGYSYLANNSEQHAFLYTSGAMVDLGTLGGSYSQASALNDAGQVTGTAYTSGNQTQHAFLYTNGAMSDIGTFGGTYSDPSGGINAAGQVAGHAYTANNASHRAFLYTNGTLIDLGTLGGQSSIARDLNDAGDIVGESLTVNGEGHAFLYRNGVMIDLGTLGGGYSSATAINATGDVTGVALTADGHHHAFLYRGGVMTDLGTLGGTHSEPTAGINASGQVAGYAYTTNNASYHAFLATPTAFVTSLTSSPAAGIFAGTATLTATLISGGSPLSGRSVNFHINGTVVGTATTDANGTATLSGASLSGAPAGSVPDGVRATFAGEQDYLPSTGIASLAVDKANQTISFGALPGRTFGDPDFALTATATSALPVTFVSVSGPCTVTGNIVHLTGGGGCAIRASQAGDSNYHPAADVEQTFTITGGSQTIAFDSLPNRIFGSLDFVLAATATSGLQVTFASLSGGCTVTGNVVHITSAGSCAIRASQPGNGVYDAAPDIDRSFTIDKAPQTITFGALAPKTFGDAAFTPTATASSGLAVGLAVSGACTVSGISVQITGAGMCTVRAVQAGNGNYHPAPDVEESFAVAKAAQTISFAPLANKTFGDGDFPVSATASSNLNLAFSTQSANCTIAGDIVHIVGAGTCVIRASQAGDANYNPAADMDRLFTVAKANQTIVLTTPLPASAVFGTTFNTAATGGGSGNPVTITVSGPCSLTSGGAGVATIDMTSGTGSCAVTFSQAGNGNYNAAASVVATTIAQKAGQVITVTTGPPAAAAYGSSFAVAATGGGSGNPISFTTPATDGCSNVGAIFTVTSGVVACQVQFNQAGNDNYSAAAQVTQVVNVVGYLMEGFSAPIDMSSTTGTVWNRANAGQAIPAKWRLTLNGTPVSLTSSFVTLLSYAVSCTSGAAGVEDVIEEYASGGSAIQYHGDGQFQFNWKTPVQYRNTCRAMYVSLSDGSMSKVASFKFR